MLLDAEILTPWAECVIVGGETLWKPLVAEWWHLTFTDVTGQPGHQIPPEPNLVVIAVRVSPVQLEEIRQDSQFHVLWAEEPRKLAHRRGTIPREELAALHQCLDRHAGAEHGKKIAGDWLPGLSRTTVAWRVKTWARSLTK